MECKEDRSKSMPHARPLACFRNTKHKTQLNGDEGKIKIGTRQLAQRAPRREGPPSISYPTQLHAADNVSCAVHAWLQHLKAGQLAPPSCISQMPCHRNGSARQPPSAKSSLSSTYSHEVSLGLGWKGGQQLMDDIIEASTNRREQSFRVFLAPFSAANQRCRRQGGVAGVGWRLQRGLL